jgi:type I restriction enzyme S subunit
VRRGKYIFEIIDVRSKTGSEELLTVSSRKGVVPRTSQKITMFKAQSYVGHKLCWPGDLVINSLWAWANGLGFAEHHGIVSSAYGVYRPRTHYRDRARYLDFALRSGAYDWEFHVRSKGIWKSRLQLTPLSFLDMPIALPPPEEAANLSSWLLHATKDQERGISATESQIALMGEYRTRLVADVVTGKVDVRAVAAALPPELPDTVQEDTSGAGEPEEQEALDAN